MPIPSLENTSASSPSSTCPLITWTRGTPARQARHGVAGLGGLGGRHRALLQRVRELVHRELAGQLPVQEEPVRGGDVDELHRAQRLGDLDRDGVGVEAVGPAVAVHAQGRHHGHDAVGEERAEQLDVDALDPSREQVIDAAQDPQRMRDDRVRARPAKVGGVEPLQDLVGEAVGGGEGELAACAASVTPDPSRSEGTATSCSARAWICAAAPWTSTVRMFSDHSTATSMRMLPKLSSSTIAPSSATTNVFSRNWGT